MHGKEGASVRVIHRGSTVPGICVELDPAKLRKGPGRRIMRYDGVTVDPRYPAS